jgi:hypothetical protein
VKKLNAKPQHNSKANANAQCPFMQALASVAMTPALAVQARNTKTATVLTKTKRS